MIKILKVKVLCDTCGREATYGDVNGGKCTPDYNPTPTRPECSGRFCNGISADDVVEALISRLKTVAVVATERGMYGTEKSVEVISTDRQE